MPNGDTRTTGGVTGRRLAVVVATALCAGAAAPAGAVTAADVSSLRPVRAAATATRVADPGGGQGYWRARSLSAARPPAHSNVRVQRVRGGEDLYLSRAETKKAVVYGTVTVGVATIFVPGTRVVALIAAAAGLPPVQGRVLAVVDKGYCLAVALRRSLVAIRPFVYRC